MFGHGWGCHVNISLPTYFIQNIPSMVHVKPLDTFVTEIILKFTDLQITYRVYRRFW